MDLTSVVQLAIGMLFIWVILAMITSQVQEWISSILKWRAGMLEDAIGNMLGSKELRAQFYDHPLIQGLFTNHGQRKPAGIPDDKFALVVFEMLIDAGQKGDEIKSTFASLKQGVNTLKNREGFTQIACSMDTLLLGIEEKADQTVDAVTEARHRMESWFNNAMERLIGAYKRRVQIVAAIAGVLIAAILNADSVAIANKLWIDPATRSSVVAQAQNALDRADAADTSSTQASDTAELQAAVSDNIDQLQSLSIPLGWSKDNTPTDLNGWMVKLGGLLVSGAAAAQGAPFWFDVMRKLISRPKPAD